MSTLEAGSYVGQEYSSGNWFHHHVYVSHITSTFHTCTVTGAKFDVGSAAFAV